MDTVPRPVRRSCWGSHIDTLYGGGFSESFQKGWGMEWESLLTSVLGTWSTAEFLAKKLLLNSAHSHDVMNPNFLHDFGGGEILIYQLKTDTIETIKQTEVTLYLWSSACAATGLSQVLLCGISLSVCFPGFSFMQKGHRSPQCQILKDMGGSGSCTFQDSLQNKVLWQFSIGCVRNQGLTGPEGLSYFHHLIVHP